MEKFTTTSTSSHSQKVNEPIIIDEGDITRKVFIAGINDTKTESGETVSGTILHQRKSKNDKWEDIESINLNSLKSGDGVKLTLRSGHLRKFYDGLTKLYTLSSKGVNFGVQEYVVGKTDETITVPEKRKKYIEKLLEENHGEEIWEELVESYPDLATKLSFARIQSNREKALNEFEKNIKESSKNESYWQEFFTNNDWIFGYGLNYKFLSISSDQPNYGCENYTGKGKQKGDYLTHSEATKVHFTVLVEIKKPETNLLAKKPRTGEYVKYRNGAWLLGCELLGGVSQLQVNCKSWQRDSEELKNRVLLDKDIYTVQPKGILVIGNTAQFESNLEQLTSFELFRRGLSNIEVLTYDELYERAKFIVGNMQNNVNEKEVNNDDSLPF